MAHSEKEPEQIALAMTGASGAAYGLRLLECLLQQGKHVDLLISDPARIVLETECHFLLPNDPQDARTQLLKHLKVTEGKGKLILRQPTEWTAPIASGSNPADAMVFCPCSAGTIGRIASGLSSNLAERAADVILKERLPLLMVLRETPLSTIHLKNMLSLSQAGAVIMPASPAFYQHPAGISELVDFMVARILRQLHIHHPLTAKGWGSSTSKDC